MLRECTNEGRGERRIGKGGVSVRDATASSNNILATPTTHQTEEATSTAAAAAQKAGASTSTSENAAGDLPYLGESSTSELSCDEDELSLSLSQSQSLSLSRSLSKSPPTVESSERRSPFLEEKGTSFKGGRRKVRY